MMVLYPAACGLNHLVHSAVAFGQVVLCEIVGDIIDYLGDLIDQKVSVMAMLWEEGDRGGRRALRTLSTLIILSNRSTLSNLRTLKTLNTLIILSTLGGWGVLIILVHGMPLLYSSTSWRNSGISTRFQPNSLRVSRKCSCVAASP